MSLTWTPITDGEHLSSLLGREDGATLYLPSPGAEGAPTDGVYVLPAGEHSLSGSQTLVFAPGARLASGREGAARLVVSGELVASLSQWIFDFGSGGDRLDVELRAGSVSEVYPQWWGASSGGMVEDADAITEMLRSVAVNGVRTVVFPPLSTYALNRTVTLLPGKRYLGDQAVFKVKATPHTVDPMFILSAMPVERSTELRGFRLDAEGARITLLHIRPDPIDALLELWSIFDAADSPSRVGEATEIVAPWRSRGLGEPAAPVPVDPVDRTALTVHGCDLRRAAIGINYVGALNVRLTDTKVAACDVGLHLDVTGGQFDIERVGVRPQGSTPLTAVWLRMRGGRLRADGVTLDGPLGVESRAGELVLRDGRFGAVVLDHTFNVATDTLGDPSGHIDVLGCALVGETPIYTLEGETIVTAAHLLRPNDVLLRDTSLVCRDRVLSPPQPTKIASVVVEWNQKFAGSAVFDGCRFETLPYYPTGHRLEAEPSKYVGVLGEPGVAPVDPVDLGVALRHPTVDRARLTFPGPAARRDPERQPTSIGLWNIDRHSSRWLPISTNRLMVRSSTFAVADFALRADGGIVEVGASLVQSRGVLWLHIGDPFGVPVVTLRSLSLLRDTSRSFYARFDGTSSHKRPVLVHQNILLEAVRDGFQVEDVRFSEWRSVTAVGGRQLEGDRQEPDPLPGIAGDLYRAKATDNVWKCDFICVKSGGWSWVSWLPYCMQGEDA